MLYVALMHSKKLLKFKKNSKLIRVNKLYFDLLKTKQLLSFFIGGIKQHQFLKLCKVIATRQLFLSFLVKLECRLEFILLKSGFAITGKQAKQLILHGHVLINNLIIRAYNYQLKLFDLIAIERSFSSKYKELLICNLFKTLAFFSFLKKRRISKKISISQIFSYFRFPSFLETNFKTFTVSLVTIPLFQEIFFPKILSLYDCNQLYFIL